MFQVVGEKKKAEARPVCLPWPRLAQPGPPSVWPLCLRKAHSIPLPAPRWCHWEFQAEAHFLSAHKNALLQLNTYGLSSAYGCSITPPHPTKSLRCLFSILLHAPLFFFHRTHSQICYRWGEVKEASAGQPQTNTFIRWIPIGKKKNKSVQSLSQGDNFLFSRCELTGQKTDGRGNSNREEQLPGDLLSPALLRPHDIMHLFK